MRKYTEIIHNYLPVLLILAVVILTVGINFSGFPHFEGDEGIYVSRAWAFANDTTLSAGEYWYDHPPLGWIFLGGWFALLRNIPVFDSYLVAGRAFIFLLNVLSALFLYKIAAKITSSRLLGVFASLLFTFSPLQIYFGRRVLLDNILVFWVLLSLFTFYSLKNIYLKIGFSALFLALAVLTKENAILFFIPYFILVFSELYKYYLSTLSDVASRGIDALNNKGPVKKALNSTIIWTALFFGVVALYPLFAAVRGELLPSGYFDSGGNPSLMSTLQYQLGRDKSSVFDFENNEFWEHLKLWVDEDPVLFGLGIVASLTNLLYSAFKKEDIKGLILALFVFFQLLFLMRGGVVYEFYIIPLLPFFSLNILYMFINLREIVLANLGIKKAPQPLLEVLPLYGLIPIVIVTFVTSLIIKNSNPYTINSSKAQLDAISWIKENVPPNSLLITDSFAKGDLYANKSIILKSQFDAAYDPTFREDVNSGDKSVDYIVYTKQIEWNLDSLDFVRGIFENGELVADFEAPDWDVKIYKTSER